MPWVGLEWEAEGESLFMATGGETEEEMIRVDILENQVMDVRLATLPPPCIVRKDPRVPHTARRGA